MSAEALQKALVPPLEDGVVPDLTRRVARLEGGMSSKGSGGLIESVPRQKVMAA